MSLGGGKHPLFPDRPDHDDFRLLSEVVRDHDNRSDFGIPMPQIVEEFVDLASLTYMATQRCKFMAQAIDVSRVNVIELMQASWFDAFVAGADYQKRKAEQ